jgi:hypothetical protein
MKTFKEFMSEGEEVINNTSNVSNPESLLDKKKTKKDEEDDDDSKE